MIVRNNCINPKLIQQEKYRPVQMPDKKSLVSVVLHYKLSEMQMALNLCTATDMRWN